MVDSCEVKMVSAMEVARRLGVGRSLVYKLLEEGQLPHVQIRGIKRISEEALDAFLRDHTIPKSVG